MASSSTFWTLIPAANEGCQSIGSDDELLSSSLPVAMIYSDTVFLFFCSVLVLSSYYNVGPAGPGVHILLN